MQFLLPQISQTDSLVHYIIRLHFGNVIKCFFKALKLYIIILVYIHLATSIWILKFFLDTITRVSISCLALLNVGSR